MSQDFSQIGSQTAKLIRVYEDLVHVAPKPIFDVLDSVDEEGHSCALADPSSSTMT